MLLRKVNIGCSSEAEDEANAVAAYPNRGTCDEDGNHPPNTRKCEGRGMCIKR